MWRIPIVAAVLLAVASMTVAKDEHPALREAPPVEDVRYISATWFDDDYQSFVRSWSVPRRHWPAVLQTVSDCQQRQHDPQANDDKPLSNHVDLRIVTTDGRSLRIISQAKSGDLKAFPYRGCKELFLFAKDAAPHLRAGLGREFRIAVEAQGEDAAKNRATQDPD